MRFLLFLCYQYLPNIEWHVGIDTFFNYKDNENIRFFAGQSEYISQSPSSNPHQITASRHVIHRIDKCTWF